MTDFYTKEEVDEKLRDKINRNELDNTTIAIIDNILKIPDKSIVNSKLNSDLKAIEIRSPEYASNTMIATEYAVSNEFIKKVNKSSVLELEEYNAWLDDLISKI